MSSDSTTRSCKKGIDEGSSVFEGNRKVPGLY